MKRYEIDRPESLKVVMETSNGEKVVCDIYKLTIDVTEKEITFKALPLFEMPQAKTVKIPRIDENKIKDWNNNESND